MGGKADWSWIPKVKQVTSVPVILNGDIATPEDARNAFDSTGCDGIMIGRASVGNPFIFRRVKQYLETGTLLPEASLRVRIDICLQHLNLTIKYKGSERGIKEFRKHYTGYLKGLHNASSYRQRLVLSDSLEEIVSILNEFEKYLSER